MKVVLGLGTNIGDKSANIKTALEALDGVPKVNLLRCSSVYETEPWGYTEQDTFYNCIAEVESDLSPNALLGVCLGIEAGMGRVRNFKNGPRVIDIDVLLCEGFSSSTDELTVPHPFILDRFFVLQPLYELFGERDVYGFSYITNYRELQKTNSAKIVEKS